MRLKGLPERAYNILFHTHTVAGIAISFGLFIIFYAGAFSIFRDEIYRWENPNARIEVVEAIDLDRVIATVKANNENFVEQSQFTIRTPDEYSPFVRFFGSEYRDETKERTKRFSALLNPNEDYEYRHLAKPETTLGNTLYRLHYFGQIPLGIYISGFVALFFLFASITGIVIHWRNLVTKFYAFTVRGKWRQIWTNAHTVLGVIGLPFQIMYAVTGALFGLLILLLIPSAFILFGGDTNKLMATVRPNAAIEVDKNAPIAEHAPLAKYFEKTKEDYP
ncbi:MAG: PepSY-associated TM helix domain-containing protein, partial [Bacteroidota bacterium]